MSTSETHFRSLGSPNIDRGRRTRCACVLCCSYRAATAIKDAVAALEAAEEQRLNQDCDTEMRLHWIEEECEAVSEMWNPFAMRKRLRRALEVAK